MKKLVCLCLALMLVLSAMSALAADTAQLRFVWWGSDARHEATLAAVARYCELYPNVQIDCEYQGYDGYQQKLMTQIAGGTEPDLMQLDYIWYPALSAQGDVFVDYTTNENVDLTEYSEGVLSEYCSIDGKVIALPMGTNGFGAMINKTFFDKHGLDVNTVWTWEEMIEVGRKIHEEDPNAYLFAIESGTSTGGVGPFVMSAYIYSKHGYYWADDAAYTINATEADFVEAFTIVKELFESGAAQPLGEASLFTGQMEQNPKWLNGEIGFTIDWSGTIGKYKESIGEENFAVAMPPFAKDGDNQKVQMKPSMVLAVSNRSEHVDIATHFANWMMTDPEAAMILGTQRSVPTGTTAFETLQAADAIDADVATMVAFTNANPAAPVPLVQSNTEVADMVKDICEQVVYGTATPEEAAAKMMTDVAAKMQEIKPAE